MQSEDWSPFRAQMPITQRWAYFDHAAVGPLPAPTASEVQRWLVQATEQGDTCWPDWHRSVERCRGRAADLLHASTDEIALVPSTTAGIGLVAEGFPWSRGDNVVTLDNEFPSNLYPWLNLAERGVETRRVATQNGRVDVNRIVESCDDRTRMVTASWVGYASGWRLDVSELARAVHDQNAYLMLDAIQGLGVFPLDVENSGVDFLAADGHKWMLGPEGAGLFYCRREHLDLLRPIGVGWHSAERPHDFDAERFQLRRDAARYEGGTQNMVGFLALGRSLDLLAEHGLSPVGGRLARRVTELAQFAVDAIESSGAQLCFERHPAHASGIVTFRLPGVEPREIQSACTTAGIVVSCRGGGVRLSLHAYNNEAEVRRLADVLSGQF